jgi:hypothetical protein
MEIAYKDWRKRLSHIEEIGQLRTAQPIDLNEDVGRITEISVSTEL